MIRYDTRCFQLARQSGHAPARSTVLVRENAAGAIELRYRGRVMHWSEIPAPPPKPAVTTAPRPALPAPARSPARRRGPSADHPWQHGADQYRTGKQLAAARRAWLAGQP